MRTPGYLLLIAGFLLGAYATALDTEATHWALFVPGALVAIVGVVTIKRLSRGAAQAEHVLTANRTELSGSLRRVVGVLEELAERAAAMSSVEVRGEIDRRLRDDLRRFADARESMVHLFGIQAYADIMSDFASGERYVNRVWSASADGYAAEAETYLRRALAKFRAAEAQLERAAGRPATA